MIAASGGLRKSHLYGIFPDIITGLELERLTSASGPTQGQIVRPSDGRHPERIAFIQCIGSRDTACGNGYCSTVCCIYAIKEALVCLDHEPELDITVFYMDMRTQGKEFDNARQRAKGKGIRFVRSRNVAVDCARAALRLGYGPVTILYRRTREEMPAYLEEVENALLEGIEIRFLVAPVAVEGKDGKVTGLTCQRLKLGEPDASGRRRQYRWRTRSSPFPAK